MNIEIISSDLKWERLVMFVRSLSVCKLAFEQSSIHSQLNHQFCFSYITYLSFEERIFWRDSSSALSKRRFALSSGLILLSQLFVGLEGDSSDLMRMRALIHRGQVLQTLIILGVKIYLSFCLSTCRCSFPCATGVYGRLLCLPVCLPTWHPWRCAVAATSQIKGEKIKGCE